MQDMVKWLMVDRSSMPRLFLSSCLWLILYSICQSDKLDLCHDHNCYPVLDQCVLSISDTVFTTFHHLINDCKSSCSVDWGLFRKSWTDLLQVETDFSIACAREMFGWNIWFSDSSFCCWKPFCYLKPFCIKSEEKLNVRATLVLPKTGSSIWYMTLFVTQSS